MTPTIRRARREEAATLTALSLISKASNGYDPSFMAACIDELRVTPERMESGDYWVAEIDGSVRGCVRLGTGEKSGHLSGFFIHPDFQRFRIGSILWQTVKAEAEAMGLERLALDADPRVLPFYEGLGFEVVGESPSPAIYGRMLPKLAIWLH